MTTYIFTNDATGTLKTAIGASDVSLTLESGDGASFPSPSTGEGFHGVMYDGTNTEWMVCTSRSTDVFTVTRGSTSYAFAAGATFEHRLHENALNQFFQKGQEREVSADPNGSAATYTGEEVLDSVNGIWYKHTTGTTWQAMNSVA
jgi:hypothetical protein